MLHGGAGADAALLEQRQHLHLRKQPIRCRASDGGTAAATATASWQRQRWLQAPDGGGISVAGVGSVQLSHGVHLPLQILLIGRLLLLEGGQRRRRRRRLAQRAAGAPH